MDELFGDEPAAHKSLSKLEIEGQESALYALCSYDGNLLSVSVCDGAKNWVGELNQRQLAHMAEQVKMSTSDYITETLKALTRENLGLSTFVYQVKGHASNKIELVWKKHLLSKNIRFQLGSVLLHENKCKLYSEHLDYAIKSLSNFQQQIAELNTDKARLISERQAALNRLEKCANIKEQVEKDLYSKFKLVLNDKKGKIRRLMEQLSQDLHTGEPQEEAPARKSDNETDDDMDSSSQPTETLLGGHTHSSPPPVKRRKRDTGSKVKGQPIEIPRPPSINRGAAATSGKGQKMRTVSSGSDAKQDSLESDELLGLL